MLGIGDLIVNMNFHGVILMNWTLYDFTVWIYLVGKKHLCDFMRLLDWKH